MIWRMEKLKESLCLWEGLENELGDIRSQIKEKTALLRTTDLTISNLCKGSAPRHRGRVIVLG